MFFNAKKNLIARAVLIMVVVGWIWGVRTVEAINMKEPLENQANPFLQSQVETALLVKDIMPGALSSDYGSFEEMNGILYFGAADDLSGGELWKSDGSLDGTVLVRDINTGSYSSSLRYLENVNGTLFFSANDGIHGHELWKSDGTADGTTLVLDIRPGDNQNTNSSSPNFLTGVNGILYFSAYDAVHGTELWKSDGTAEGTILVQDINPGSSSSNPEQLININGTLFFTATDPASGTELWKSDGTSDGTLRVKDIYPGIAGGDPDNLTDVNGVLFFSAAGNLSGYNDHELWKSDGTSAGTILIRDIYPGVNPSYPDNLENVNGVLFFSASDGVHGNELWKSNGTLSGTVMVKDVWPGDQGSWITPHHIGSTVYFGANDGMNGAELWKSDGTTVGTVMVKDIVPGFGSSVPQEFASANGVLYFVADDGISEAELWKSDGTSAGTMLVRDINPTGESWPSRFTDANGTLFFTANDGEHGYELWKIGWGDPPPPTSTPSVTPSPIFTITPSATPGTITISGNVGVSGASLNYFDGVDKTTTSDVNGNYVISIQANSWSGTVQPTKAGYRFWPITMGFSNLTSSTSNANFTAERLFIISGNVGVTGVTTLDYIDISTKYVDTDGYGNFSILVPQGWAGTITPTRPGYRFTPANKTFSNVQTDLFNQDFIVQRVYTISGSTRIAGVTLSYTDGTPKTVVSNSYGNYSFQVPENWSGTVTASKAGYSFTPASRAYSNVTSDQGSQNHFASPFVTNTNAYGTGSLSQAISNALAGDTITFDPALAGQTITPGSQLVIGKNLIIDGSGLTPRITISGNKSVRIFSVRSNYTATLKSLILKDGLMAGTTYDTYGGAIYTESRATLSITNVAFMGNKAYQAGAIYISPYANVTILDSEFTSNSSDTNGGIIYAQSLGNLTIKNSLIQNNTAYSAGGALYLAAAGTRILENNTFSANTAGSAGAIMIEQTSNSNTTLKGNLFAQNLSTSSVGGGGAIRITLSSIPAVLNAENNTFHANQAVNVGGAVWSEGDSSFVHNTFSGNRADKAGGNGGGSLYLTSSFGTDLNNNIIANNAGGGECASYGSNYVAGSYNLIEGSTGACSALLSTIVADPILGTLADNGGPTWTMVLLPGSPAIDAGNDTLCTPSDQRGYPRPSGAHCDIGAYEEGAAPAPTATPLPTQTPGPTVTLTPSITPSPYVTITPTAFITPTFTYTPVPSIITISGNTGTSYVTLSYLDGGLKTVLSNSSGDYSITIAASYWSGTITPSKAGYRFSPASRNYTIFNSVSNMNYSAERVFTMSGNTGSSGVVLSYTDGTAKTVNSDSNGDYSFQVPENWTGNVVPSKTNYIFSPASRSYTTIQTDQIAQHYLATPLYNISGNAGVIGAELSYTEDGVTKIVTSGSDGSYLFRVKAGWSGIVTPIKAGVTFTPASKSYTDVQADHSGSNYNALITVTTITDGGAGSLRQAVIDSVVGTSIRFDPNLAGQKITLVSTISIAKTLTIDGSGLNLPVTISGGGVVRIFSMASQSNVTLRSLTLRDGSATGSSSGGAIYMNGGVTLNIDDVSFISNTAYDGGAIYSALYNTHLTISDSEFLSNSARRGGGAIYLENGDLLLQSSIFDGNTATSTGGAMLLTRGDDRMVRENIFSNNSATSGGAVHLLSLENSNTLQRNLFSNNIATSNGGAIFESLPYTTVSTTLENNTFYTNQAERGGAVLASRMIIKNNTFSNNRATLTGGNGGGSILLWAPMTIQIHNNILANAITGGECFQGGSGVVNKSGGGNLIEDGSTACLPTWSGDPSLGSLADHGGRTQTIALLSNSPAIDAGDDAFCPATDQRGVSRPQGSHCDIGAYEANQTTHSIPLLQGWNLISFNVHPTDTSVSSVLSSIEGNYDLVYAWDASGAHSASGNWLKADNIPESPDNLTSLNETMGFWIRMTAADTLDVMGTVPPSTNVSLLDNAGGWNLVAYPSNAAGSLPNVLSDQSVGADFAMAYAYHPEVPGDVWKLYDVSAPPMVNDLTQMIPGFGYWVKVNADHTWVVNYGTP